LGLDDLLLVLVRTLLILEVAEMHPDKEQQKTSSSDIKRL
jgi:hypothetical protein